MIALAAALLSATAGALDCSPPAPLQPADPEAARAYLEVGEEERRQGSGETALQAYREALRRDPASAAARARMLELCHPEQAAFAGAAAAIEEGRPEDAARLLEPLYRASPDPPTALLYGIALYERGEDRRARPLLEEAARAPGTREAATLFLGLLLLRAGDSERAAALFDRVRAWDRPGLARAAQDLAALARGESRLAVSATLDGGYDSNVDQAPDVTDVASLSGDRVFGLSASALLRPSGERGLQATASLGYREQWEIVGYDLLWAGAALGHAWGGGPRLLRLEYAYDHVRLGGHPFLHSHQLSAAGRAELGALELRGSYAARLEAFLDPPPGSGMPAPAADYRKYSGLVHDADAGLALPVGGWAVLAAAYRGQWDGSLDPSVGWTEHGPRLQLWALLGQVRAGLQGELLFRAYLDPGLPRQDTYLDAELSVELDLLRQLTLFVELSARKAYSSELRLEHTRFAGKAGLSYTAGLW